MDEHARASASTMATTIQVSQRVRGDLVDLGKNRQLILGRPSPPTYNEVIEYLLEYRKRKERDDGRPDRNGPHCPLDGVACRCEEGARCEP